MKYSEQVLITCDAEAVGIALAELRQIQSPISQTTLLETGDSVEGGVILVQTGMPFEEFARLIDQASPVFIRHLAPVQHEIALAGNSSDLALLTSTALNLTKLLDLDRTFAVQSRILGEGKLPYRKVEINESLSTSIAAETGAIMDCRHPGQVVSVLCTANSGYIGISPVELNRSAWPGGKHRFKKEDDQISRAEFKLLEACSVFNLSLPKNGISLDMGASPGGWTRILSNAGLTVYAVDPGDIDSSLHNRPGVKHIRSRIQDYLAHAGRFDMIVNDMKMDARASVRIMLDAHCHIAPGGLAVMTLKLPKLPSSAKMNRKMLGIVNSNLDRLRDAYTVVGARQLYHNRSEVTVVLRA